MIEDYELIENNSKKFYTGSEWSSNSCGKFKILGKFNKTHYLCEFEDGTLKPFRREYIRTGMVKNPNNPNVFGIGFIGQGKYFATDDNHKISKEYILWHSMIRRCYSEYVHKRQPTYKECIVDNRWHNYQNFCEDIQHLKMYNEWKKDTCKINKYEIDKDIKIKNNKIYSKDTCIFVTKSQNASDANKRNKITGLTYIGTRIQDGYVENFINQSEFSKKWNLSSSHIGDCVKGRSIKHKGWTFKIKGEEI